MTAAVDPIRVAYADPPYPGKSRKYYRDHPDYAGEVDHAELIARLEDEFPDGWALSTSMDALPEVLALCPGPISRGRDGGGVRRQFRTMAWCKPNGQNGSSGGPLYAWEPLVVRGGRRTFGEGRPLDWLVASPERFEPGAKPAGHVTGAKPLAFCHWLFRSLGLRAGDELVDVFVGSGAVARAWSAYVAQGQLVETA